MGLLRLSEPYCPLREHYKRQERIARGLLRILKRETGGAPLRGLSVQQHTEHVLALRVFLISEQKQVSKEVAL